VTCAARAAFVATALASLVAASAHGMQRSDFRFGGTLLRGAAGDKSLYLLVGGKEKEPRQLLALRLAADGPKLVTLATDLPATSDTIVAAPAGEGGGVLVADGRRVSAFDWDGGERRLVYSGPDLLIAGEHSGRLAPSPPWLAAGSAGEARRLRFAGDSLQPGTVQAVPVTASLARWGLHLESPPARFVGPWLAVGPAQEGIHLRTVLLGAGGERQELTSELPEPERVAESAVVTLDGRPTLVVGSFRGLGVMSRKRLRIFALVTEPGAPPRRPLLARELSARAWQDLEVRAGDFDGDKHDDLEIVAPEGLGGGDATVTLFRGMGGGRLYAEPVEASFPVGDRDWRYGDVDGDGRPDLVTLGGGVLEVRTATASGLPAKKPTLSVKVDGTDLPSRRTVEVAVGTHGTHTETGREATPAATPAPTATPLPPAKRGAQPAPTPAPTPQPPRLPAPRWELLDVDGDRKAELLWWAADAGGETHLILLRF
jgi:hypothetical protein